MVQGFNDLKAVLLAGAIVLGHLAPSAPERTHAGMDTDAGAIGTPYSLVDVERHPACAEIRSS